MPKKPVYGNPLRPVSRQTASAMGWLNSEDRELKTWIVPKEQSIKNKGKGAKNIEICPKCGVEVSNKNMRKHLAKMHSKKSVIATPEKTPAILASCLLCRPATKGVLSNGIKSTKVTDHLLNVHRVENLDLVLEKYYSFLPQRDQKKERFLTISTSSESKNADENISYKSTEEGYVGFAKGKNNREIKVLIKK